MGKIIKIGSWDKAGMPTGWHIDLNETPPCGYIIKVDEDGKVFVGDIEMVEWTEARHQIINST